MKGHVKLELRNANGETKVVHQDNLITNAVPMFIGNFITEEKTISVTGTNYNSVNLSHSLGGIILFANTLIEDKNNIKFPIDNPVLAFGSDINDTSKPALGTFISSGSGNTENGFKFVWDFSSSQANGTIKAVALTNATYTYLQRLMIEPCHTLGSKSNISNTTFSRSDTKIISIDEQGSFYILYRANGKSTIYKFTTTLKGVLKPSTKDTFETIKVINSSIDDICDGFDGYAYTTKISSNKNATIKRYKLSDFTFEEDAGFTINLFDNRFATSSSIDYYYCVVYNGYIYVFTYDKNYIMIFDLSTGEKKDDIAVPFSDLISISRFSDTKVLMFSTAGATYEFDLLNKVFKKTLIESVTNSSVVTRPGYSVNKYNIQIAVNSNRDMCVFQAYNYLGTICNLKTPIEKTADQTLRVTYTLTDLTT